jgi:osmotically-inducible protein OsmY
MNLHTLSVAAAAVTLLVAAGCAVTRGQETVGAYVGDATISTQIKSRFVENKDVEAASIKVETLSGPVMLSRSPRTPPRGPRQRPSRAASTA